MTSRAPSIAVDVPYKNVFDDECISRETRGWLIENVGIQGLQWDFEFWRIGDNDSIARFRFRDDPHAVLFKLRWG